MCCISKISNALIDNAEDLDTVMQTCNLIKYVKCYSKTSGSLRKYYRDETSDPIIESESLKFIASIIESIPNDNGKKEVDNAVAFKYLTNFWSAFD